MMNAKNPLIIYLHVPKTGGSTLNQVLRRQFNPQQIYGYTASSPQFSELPEVMKARMQCVHGHFYYGIHQYFSQPSTYITMLRDPIDRVISLYYYILQTKENRMHHKVKGLNLEEFITSKDRDLHLSVFNKQTQLLSGQEQPDLMKAKQNLKQSFSVVGLTERYVESVFLVGREFNWSNISYTKINVTKKRPRKADLPKNILDEIKRKNLLDLELYEYGKSLFEKQLAGLSEKEKQELASYSKLHGK